MVKLVNTVDLKSIAFIGLSVRVRPRLPSFNIMKVKAKALLEVELDREEALKVTVQTLRRALQWPQGAYIDQNGNLVVDHDGHTSHKFINETEIIRKADEEDFALRKILYRLSVGRF